MRILGRPIGLYIQTAAVVAAGFGVGFFERAFSGNDSSIIVGGVIGVICALGWFALHGAREAGAARKRELAAAKKAARKDPPAGPDSSN